MNPPDPRLDMHDLGPDRDKLLSRIPFDPDPMHVRDEDLVEVRRDWPVVVLGFSLGQVLLAALLGVTLGFLIAHVTLAASRAAHQEGVAHLQAATLAVPDAQPEASMGAGASHAPAAATATRPGSQPTPSPSGAPMPEHLLIVTPAPRPAVEQPAGDVAIVTPKPVVVLPPANGATGWASWYDWRPGEAAAGPALRVGDWRGRLVTVCASSCIRVRLTDFCGCPNGRVIDLDDASFAQLAPLSRGLIRVTVTW